jgi:hypothetical protein
LNLENAAENLACTGYALLFMMSTVYDVLGWLENGLSVSKIMDEFSRIDAAGCDCLLGVFC